MSELTKPKYNHIEINPHTQKVLDLLHKFPTETFQANLVDVIAFNSGWFPLENNEKMTVHFDDKEYLIKRTK